MASGSVRACSWPDDDSVSFRNPLTQQLGGIDIELSAAFAQDRQA